MNVFSTALVRLDIPGPAHFIGPAGELHYSRQAFRKKKKKENIAQQLS